MVRFMLIIMARYITRPWGHSISLDLTMDLLLTIWKCCQKFRLVYSIFRFPLIHLLFLSILYSLVRCYHQFLLYWIYFRKTVFSDYIAHNRYSHNATKNRNERWLRCSLDNLFHLDSTISSVSYRFLMIFCVINFVSKSVDSRLESYFKEIVSLNFWLSVAFSDSFIVWMQQQRSI